jgi:hypothetical protein
MPAEDRYLLTVEELEDRLAVMLGGRAAEKIVFGTISTGMRGPMRVISTSWPVFTLVRNSLYGMSRA